MNVTEERLGIAFCNLNTWKWDDLLGPKPKNFDFMTCDQKMPIIRPAIALIESVIGEDNTNKWWWIIELGRTESEWRAWYYGDHSSLLPEDDYEYEHEEEED